MKLTPWFPGTVKPVRVGVYERQYDKETFYCRWDGEYWHAWAMTPKHAEKLPGFSALQNLPWRGVLNDPQPPSLPSPLLCLQPRHARPPGQQPAAGDLAVCGMHEEGEAMTTLREAAQQALEALEQRLPLKGQAAIIDELNNLRAALAQQAEPVQDQRCRAEPRSDGDFVCDCKIGECPRRSAALAQKQAEPLNLRDPAVQKRLATQWGYVPAAQAEPVEPVVRECSDPMCACRGGPCAECEEGEREKEIEDLRSSLYFYQRRCEALQSWQSKMRDPERTIVCDILANGKTLDPAFAGDRYTAPPQQAEPEPVAWSFEARHIDTAWGLAVSLKHPGQEHKYLRNVKPLYAAPPQRTMVPLTEEEIERIGMKHVTLREVIRAVERAHGIKEN